MKSINRNLIVIAAIILIILAIYLFVGEPEEISSSDWATIYSIALDETIPLDDALNHDMEYISIDLESLTNIDEDSADMIFGYFEKYGVEVRGDSFANLKEQGMVGEFNSLDGILLYVEDIEPYSNKRVKIHCAKFRSGVGAIGIEVELVKDGDSWIVENTGSTWIS